MYVFRNLFTNERLILDDKVRLLNAFRFVLRSERSRTPITPAQLFQPLITESHGSIMELDYNIHSKLIPGDIQSVGSGF